MLIIYGRLYDLQRRSRSEALLLEQTDQVIAGFKMEKFVVLDVDFLGSPHLIVVLALCFFLNQPIRFLRGTAYELDRSEKTVGTGKHRRRCCLEQQIPGVPKQSNAFVDIAVSCQRRQG